MNLIIAASSGGVTDILRETAETFGWNWKLFLSQVISFCIVAFLLQRFAYKPILAVLEERRRKIEEGQLNAEKIKKELAEAEKRYQEIRQLSRAMLRASFTDGQLDPGRTASLVDSLIARKPRHYVEILKNYRRLLRLELEKRQARIETASEVDSATTSELVANLKKKYGGDLKTEFVVNPELLGGMRIRVGSDVWDGTVRNRLERLQQEL